LKKTYVTTMPDHIGAFLKASQCFSSLNINITRVSYNKAVDLHTLFIDAEGTKDQLARADEELAKIGYLQEDAQERTVMLIEFHLKDVPGSVTKVLELIERFRFNISFLSSQENGSGYQPFKMGLFVEDVESINRFLQEAGKICPVRIIEYDKAEKVFDNTIFYRSFVDGLLKVMGGGEGAKERLLINANLAMQTLDERGLSPYRTFESIRSFAELLFRYKGDAFSPRITEHRLTENTALTLIEPPCGSNTAILRHGEDVLFLDTGYACYRDEMQTIFRRIIPGFDGMKKTVLITHADVDHCGLLPMFDAVILSKKSAQCLKLEHMGEDGFREQNPLHKPYIHICKCLTSYPKADLGTLVTPWADAPLDAPPLSPIGNFHFGDLTFTVYEGKGGHLPGEVILVDESNRIAFTGDVYINLGGMTEEQKQYNTYAPILMTSVDTDPALCAKERSALMGLLTPGAWRIFGAHGAPKEVIIP